jgi:DNA uptake protein ComE-like DNA-binding protein
MLNWWKRGQMSLDPAQRAARDRLRRDPFARLRDAIDVAAAVELGVAIDANRASADDWLRLPGLSIHQANALAKLTAGGVQFHGLDDVAAALGMPVARLEPIADLLRFYYYDPHSSATIQPVDANDAPMGTLTATLAQIPAIAPELAEAIVAERTARGPFRSLADLQRRLRLSGEQTATLMYYLRF